MKLKMTLVIGIVAAALYTGRVNGQDTTGLNSARYWFNRLDSLCSVDHGKLWGVDLYGPTLFVFPESRIIIANQPDNDGDLVEKDGLYIGRLPDDVNIANTSTDWNGIKWTMVNRNAVSDADPYSGAKLLIHESWHRNQEAIGIKAVMTQNAYLDDLQGMILLKLEMMALSRALSADSANRTASLADALTIRAYRQSLFPGNNEDEFELHEGMPEYTGFELCGIDKKLLPVVVAKQLNLALDKEGLANSFPYLTGPAYGILFDELTPGWIEAVKNGKTLPDIGRRIVNTELPSDTAVLREDVADIVKRFGADTLIQKETHRFEAQQQLADAYENKFFGGNILVIKNNNVQMSFNPQEKLVPVRNGVVYKTMRLTAPWGIAEVSNGIFRSNDWQLFILPAPVAGTTGAIDAPGYHLTLNDGWQVAEVKKGTYTFVKE